jgi:hypothetical protein
MEISGTLHLYSGKRRELFFVFDDDVAQLLYEAPSFRYESRESRRVYVSVGTQRFISQRTLSFSQKQTEIKVSLCAKGSKDNLGSLTALYDWYVPRGIRRPAPFPLLGSLSATEHEGHQTWELHLQEPLGMVLPPGLPRRRKSPSLAKRMWQERRLIVERETAEVSRAAEQIALSIVEGDFPKPHFQCLWRDAYYDSERPEVRKYGIIADIDVIDENANRPALFVEVKAQKVSSNNASARFYLSRFEWQSLVRCRRARMHYQVWLIQYHSIDDLRARSERLRLLVFKDIQKRWLRPETLLVIASRHDAEEFEIEWT